MADAHEFEIVEHDPTRVVAAVEELSAAQEGWITLQPGVHPDDAPPPGSLLGRIFSGGGPPVPVCTWVAPEVRQRPPHAEVGIMHATGPKAEQRLAAAGCPVPDRWVVLSDHPRRGLVVAVHPESAAGDVVAWLLAAGRALSRIPTTGRWRIEVHRRG